MPITVLDLAIHRGAKSDPEFSDESFSVEAIEATGLRFFSGCGPCTASLGPFDAYPSKLGSIRCKDCIGQNGFETVEEANAFIFPPEDEDTLSDCGYPDCSCGRNRSEYDSCLD